MAERPLNRARINKDNFRSMLHDGTHLGHDTERQIRFVRDAAVSTLLRQGINVVDDNTNLQQKSVREIAKHARALGATVTVWDMTDVPFVVCVERDAARVNGVGDTVINEMFERYLKGKNYPLPLPEDEPDPSIVPYTPRPGTPEAVMVDIDGTVALHGDRSPYDWSRVREDMPNPPVITCVRELARNRKIIFCSGRTEECRQETEAWLDEHVGVPYEALHMRATGDNRKDAIVKRELFDREIRDDYTVIFALDDRQRVVDGWRELGLTVFQVAPGNF